MFNKLMLSALGLMAAVTGPMVFFAVSDYWKTGRLAAAPVTVAPTAGPTPGSGVAPLAPSPLAGPEPAMPLHRLEDVFRFDITPEWIMRRWPQVATGLARSNCRATVSP